MGRPKEAIDDETARKAEEILKELPHSELAIKLQAIISAAKHPVGTVASVMGFNRVSMWRWIRRFQEQGLAGLEDKPRGHNPSKLTPAHKKEIERWLNSGKDAEGNHVHWTLQKLAQEIQKLWGIEITKTPLWIQVRGMGFRLRAPRPAHAKADENLREAYKKNG
jgi:transposase